MNGKTYPYLDLVALAPVGATLLDPRPALVFSGDGARILWANAAGVALFDERHMADLLDRRLSGLNPLKAQIARLARLLPSEASRLEILRIGQGVTFTALAAACRRLNLADRTSAVFVVAAAGTSTESLVTRAERLADTIAEDDCLAAVLTDDGKVLGASGGYDALSTAEAAIDALVASAGHARDSLAKQTIAIDGGERPAGVAHFTVGTRSCFLLIVGPAAIAAHEPQAAEPVATPPVEPAPEPAPPVAKPVTETPSPAQLAAPRRPAPERVLRFTFALDRDRHFIFVSPELARAVGAAQAAIAGKSWEAVDDVLDLDPEGTIGAALPAARTWSARVRWPAGGGETIAVDLSAFPVPTPDGHGFRGFGLCHPDHRQADRRAERRSLDEIAEIAEIPAIEPAKPQPDEPPAAPSTAAEPPAPEPATDVPVVESEPPAERPPVLHVVDEDLDDMARKTVEESGSQPPPRFAAPGRHEPATPPSNIVRLPGTPARPPQRLSGIERDAFDRIAETLRVRQDADRPAARADGEKPDDEAAEPPVSAKAPAVETDTRLLDRLPVGLVVFRDNRTLFANRALLELAGYESLAAFVAAGGVNAIFPDGAEGWANGTAVGGGRLTVKRSDGEPTAVDARLNAVTWSEMTALMLTISERREDDIVAEDEESLIAALAAAEARSEELAAILDTATDGVIVIDRVGRIGSMNRAGEALFGIDASDYIGHPFTELLAGESHRSALDYLEGLAANGVASVLNDGREVIGRVPQGGLIPLFMTMGHIGAGEKFCAVLRDITHWKNVEEELVAARRAAESANAQKSDFLAKISHEIRTPLNAIIGFSEVMMEERFGAIGNERYRAYLKDIHVSGQHLMSLINDLLDLSKIEAGKLELSFEAVAVNSTIQECVALMQPQANRAHIIIRTSLSGDVPNVVADSRSLRQILLNLLSNAVKFTRAGGQVIVSSAMEANGEVVVRIRDTGVGMSEKDVETALKPFRQLATAKNGDQRGTGLGLPLTKALVEANRASFAIDSAVDQGTLVRITFPTTRVLAG
jgi:PAS domain S-box-containing protein